MTEFKKLAVRITRAERVAEKAHKAAQAVAGTMDEAQATSLAAGAVADAHNAAVLLVRQMGAEAEPGRAYQGDAYWRMALSSTERAERDGMRAWVIIDNAETDAAERAAEVAAGLAEIVAVCTI